MSSARERFQQSIERVRSLAPEAEVAIVTPGEIAFRLHGLEFARARMAMSETSFRAAEELVFGREKVTSGASSDIEQATRLIDQNFIPLFDAMPLQDAVDYAIYLIHTTIETLRFEPRFPTVGGPIDVLVIQPKGLHWVQRKELRGKG